MLSAIMLLAGGIAVFLLGLRFIGENAERALGHGFDKRLKAATDNPFSAVLIGTGVTCFAQSSVAINMALISLVDAGVVSFFGACAVIVGTNIGTTVTAQLTSLSFSKFDVTAVGSLAAFCGFVTTALRGGKYRSLGDIFIGFGLIFIAIEIMTRSMRGFYPYEWFTDIFSIKSPPILLLNGFFVTAICQSSSVVSSILVILAYSGKIDFSSAAYVILGANVGTCMAVIFSSRKKCAAARQAALFNLLFNAAGVAILGTVFYIFNDFFVGLFLSGSSIPRAVANFHTAFNVIAALVLLPFIKPLGKLCRIIENDEAARKKKNKVVVGRLSDGKDRCTIANNR